MIGNSPTDPDSDSIKWRVRLGSSKAWIVLVIFVAALGAGFFGVWMFHTALMGLIGFAMILGSTADYWLGANYSVDSKGASSRVGFSLSSMEWQEVQRVVFASQSIKLSPLSEATKMEVFRGVVLRTTDAVRDKVEEVVRARVSASALGAAPASETVKDV